MISQFAGQKYYVTVRYVARKKQRLGPALSIGTVIEGFVGASILMSLYCIVVGESFLSNLYV